MLFRTNKNFLLPDVAVAHRGALSDAAGDAVIEGSIGQLLAVEVRDEIGPVLAVTAFFSSRILSNDSNDSNAAYGRAGRLSRPPIISTSCSRKNSEEANVERE